MLKHLRFGKGFNVAFGNKRSQVATMVIEPGQSEGSPENKHNGSDQWLYVVSGRGEAIVNGKTHALRAGSMLLIERGQTHEIKNLGRTLLKTVNIYVPPGYSSEGDTLPAGQPGD